jgi:hypothetical protein
MTLKVKRFIEENIDAIDAQDWRGVFLSWYLHYGDYVDTDAQNIKELFAVLSQAYEHVKNNSFHARAEIVTDTMEDYINIAVTNPKKKVVTFSEVVSSLNSRLGIEIDGLRLFFRKAAKNCGFEVPLNKLHFEVRDDND